MCCRDGPPVLCLCFAALLRLGSTSWLAQSSSWQGTPSESPRPRATCDVPEIRLGRLMARLVVVACGVLEAGNLSGDSEERLDEIRRGGSGDPKHLRRNGVDVPVHCREPDGKKCCASPQRSRLTQGPWPLVLRLAVSVVRCGSLLSKRKSGTGAPLPPLPPSEPRLRLAPVIGALARCLLLTLGRFWGASFRLRASAERWGVLLSEAPALEVLHPGVPAMEALLSPRSAVNPCGPCFPVQDAGLHRHVAGIRVFCPPHTRALSLLQILAWSIRAKAGSRSAMGRGHHAGHVASW